MIENQHHDRSTCMKKVLMHIAWKCCNHVHQLQNSYWNVKLISLSTRETKQHYMVSQPKKRIQFSNSSTHLVQRLTLWKQYLAIPSIGLR